MKTKRPPLSATHDRDVPAPAGARVTAAPPQGDGRLEPRDTPASRREFLLALSDGLRHLADPVAVHTTACTMLGEHLHADRVCYATFAGDDFILQPGYARRAPRLDGRWPISSIASFLRDACHQGQAVAVDDVAADPRFTEEEREQLTGAEIGALAGVVVRKGGHCVGAFAACAAAARVWTADDLELIGEVAERVWAAAERARAEAITLSDLRDTRLLQDLGATLVPEDNQQDIYDVVLDAAIALTEAAAGTVHIVEGDGARLELLAASGFPAEMGDRITRAGVTAESTCGIALATGSRTFADFDGPDVGHLESSRLHVDAGYRSGQSTPLVTRGGRTVGIVSTHWHESGHRLTERQLRLLDLLARQAADLLERRHSERRLRESREQLANELADTRRLQELGAALVHDQDLPSFYDAILDAALAIMRADFASLHRLETSRDPRGELSLLCVSGFTPETSADWGAVTTPSDSVCGRALLTGTRLVVADLEDGRTARDSAEHEVFRRAGVRAVQTTPLVTRNGTTVGLLSTYWRQPRAPTERECRWFDLLARQVADLLERTEAVAALRRSERELKEADRRKNEFLAVLAHELRNPLAPVRTGLELMRLAGDNRFAVERVRGMMERQVAHMVRLIDDLLDVSRITSGKIRLQREISLLPELVQGAIEASRADLTAGRFELVVDLPSDPVWLDVDPTRFVQVVSNLLHNALKFSEDGGRIAIAGRVVDDPSGAGKELMLTVTDSGIGISREMLPRVFDLFTQDESAVNRSNTGLGIGLALSSRLMTLHGGTIEATSDGPGLGSTFTVRMPIVHERAAPAPPRPGQGPQPTTRSVLVIDDNADAANTTAMLVETLGGSCEVAYDGASGFAKALVLRPDVILLDIGMPGMDGYQTCRKIRSALGQEVVIVAVTGWGQEQDKDEAYRAGFNAHLTKPADPAALEHLLAADTGG